MEAVPELDHFKSIDVAPSIELPVADDDDVWERLAYGANGGVIESLSAMEW